MNAATAVDTATANQALSQAAVSACRAPSIHNTQPWRWQVRDGVADLYAERLRQLRESDPDGRMLTISCGAALHHALVALAAEGYLADVRVLPDAGDPDRLARVTITERTPVTAAAVRHFQTTEIRRTDRRPLADIELPSDTVDELRAAAITYGIGFDVLDRGQVIDLASAIARAQRDQVADAASHAELDAWAGRHRPSDAGVPDANIPAQVNQTTVPGRDFGHVGGLPTTGAHDTTARYAILYGLDDEPDTWLRAGEALSALWLTATEHNVAVLPLSAAAESPATRALLRNILAGVGYPCLALRFGVADPAQASPPRTPRMPVSQTVQP